MMVNGTKTQVNIDREVTLLFYIVTLHIINKHISPSISSYLFPNYRNVIRVFG